MKVYLAASFSRQKEMRQFREELLPLGIEVVSRWLEEQPCPAATPYETFMCRMALIDVADLKEADIVIRFTHPGIELPFSVGLATQSVPAYLATGGCLTESGLAVAWGKPLLVVGGKQNVFDFLPQVRHFNTKEDLLTYLGATKWIN